MTKIIVQHFVENLLKVLKVLKTRTALIRNKLAEFRYATHGKALKRHSKQRSRAHSRYIKKSIEKILELWYNIIRERKVLKMGKPRLSKSTIEKLYNGEEVTSGKYEYEVKTEWDDKLKAYCETLYRWDENNNYKAWKLGCEGLWEFER
nr:MAG TPA: hypothetical protein [Microviridae sp.]